MKTQNTIETIKDAYISVELKAELLKNLRDGLKQTFDFQGVDCEDASSAMHVSIAYTQGEALLAQLKESLEKIACESFEVRVSGFEILEGKTTPYDYLTLTLDSTEAFKNALSAVQGCTKVRRFDGGFKSHISLLRFPKGILTQDWAQNLIRELNASSGAAFALGKRMCFQGECLSVFNPERQCCLQLPFQADASRASHVA